jgi:hypothetical protein
LGDAARARLDQGDRDGFALLVEELGHTQLLPKDADGHGGGKNASVDNLRWKTERWLGVLIVMTQ